MFLSYSLNTATARNFLYPYFHMGIFGTKIQFLLMSFLVGDIKHRTGAIEKE